ncbi:MATE family efflux transporter [Haladaptatus sp. DYSN1]|uniref:MATE family efflux transporter n=2 Tax=Haladaptatus TaxID=367188 RepID=UPI0024062942|nr:MATE family efflux transporter [Haladaptatus sp. DYSN1]
MWRPNFELSPSDITDGPLLRALVVLSAPLLVQNLVQVVVQIVDLIFLGRLSGDAVAAVGLAAPAVALLFSFSIFIPYVGTQIRVAQRIGGENVAGARRSLGSGIYIALGVGTLLGVIAWFGAQPLVSLLVSTNPMSVDGVVPVMAIAYLGTIALGLPLIALGDTLEAGLVAWGDSRASLWMNLTSVGVNIVLDPLLIFGYGPIEGMGVTGAALATVIGYSSGMLLGLTLIIRGRNGGMLSERSFVVDASEIRAVFEVGLPTAVQQGTNQIVRLIIVAVVFAVGGVAGIAAYTVGARVASIAFIPAQGLQQAAQSIVGQNLGAKKLDRAKRTTWLGVRLAAIGLGVIGVIQWLLPVVLTEAFVPELSPEGLALSVEYLRILAYGYPALGAIYLFQAGFNGASRTKVSMYASVVQYWGVRLPIAAVGGLVLSFGMHAVFWAVTLSNIAAAVGLGIYFYHSANTGMFRRASATAAD